MVLTRGAGGSTAFLASAPPVSVPAVPVEVVNTIGAGDAFTAAVLTWPASAGALGRGGVAELASPQAEEMLAYASRVAASVCARAGTEPSPSARV